MILVTGATGQTGMAIIKSLLAKKQKIRAFAHKIEHVQKLKGMGVKEVIIGDMRDQQIMNKAFKGVRAAYHICSAVNPDEVQIGLMAINAARSAQIEHFVFHSVLHSRLHDLPHHQKKLMVEEMIVNSNIPYSVIQPAVLMQNILPNWKLLSEEGIFEQRFFTSKDTRICMVDLEDVAEATSTILTNSGHTNATYEICGPDNLSLSDVLAVFHQNFGRQIKVQTMSDELWITQMKKFGFGDYQISTLLTMFHHYNNHNFAGNSNILKWIIGRTPNNFSSFISKTMKN